MKTISLIIIELSNKLYDNVNKLHDNVNKLHDNVCIAVIYIENKPMLKLLIEMTIELLLSM